MDIQVTTIFSFWTINNREIEKYRYLNSDIIILTMTNLAMVGYFL